MNILDFYSNIRIKSPLYILDDFQEIVLKAERDGDNVKFRLKHKGCKEVSIDSKSKTVFDGINGGEFIERKKYEDY
ncbi:MAG: hypothetical protein K2H01_04725 [Ruminococcus sp.]|nr:hypothetical protein [Ruminococcus sp.]